MPNLLGLKGAELEIYAIIYSFSSSGKPFTGSINWICDFIDTNYKTVIKYLKSLTEKGYIIKKDENANNGTTNAYTVNPEFVYVPEKTPAETIGILREGKKSPLCPHYEQIKKNNQKSKPTLETPDL